jgi:predicted nucleic acid-binding protein
MKLLIDTTYLLPVLGISVKKVPKDAAIKLLDNEHQLFISDLTLFELAAKGAKYVASDMLEADSVSRGIRVIAYEERLERVKSYETSILLTAFTLRRIINDFLDCLILSSAINNCDVFVTEDDRIHELQKRLVFQEIIKTVNSRFQVKRLSDLIDRT